MTYKQVPARYDYGPRRGPMRAFLVHMAEGGGTVAYLAGSPARGVSVHYVIEYTGRIVQMLPEAHASGSVNPQEIRTTDDPDGFYGRTAAVAVLGSWADDPNAAVISVELEGFAKMGPNVNEVLALQSLVIDVRSRFPTMGLLGHRDFAEYKACPGKLIPWSLLGGHGPAGGSDVGLDIKTRDPIVSGKLVIPKGTIAYRLSTRNEYHVGQDTTRTATIAESLNGTQGYQVDLVGDAATDVAHFIYAGAGIVFTPDPAVDCSVAVAAEHERTKASAVAAVEAI